MSDYQPVDGGFSGPGRVGPGGSLGPLPVGWAGAGRLPFLLMVLAILVFMLVFPYFIERVQYAMTRGAERAKAEVARSELEQLGDPGRRFVLVAKSVEPSVVGIETVRLSTRRVWGDEWSQLFPQPYLRERGIGSGVIVDPSGYLVTNFHVIDQAAALAVKLSDGRTIRNARVVGVDPLNDLAVLKIDADGLVAAPWGDSDQLEVGDQVLAIGNPYGLARTVTAGIISAKERRAAVGNRGFQEFLQTDAALNPGNSGGPLVNLKGQIVGINTAIFGEAYRGISFAIPSRVARQRYEQLKATGKTSYGWLGVAMGELAEADVQRLGLPAPGGVLVADVVPGSPAEKAGIQPGDVIVQWGDRRIKDPAALSISVAHSPIGATVTVKVWRQGRELALDVMVAERPLHLGTR